MVKRDGVYRYPNRNPTDDLTTRDHRLELIKIGDDEQVRIDKAIELEMDDLPIAIVSIGLAFKLEKQGL